MRLLLVDDEKYTRDGIKNNINFDELGIDDVVYCKNAASAIQAANEKKPDILLTDIRMGRMSGIDLAKEIVSMYPECKIIFMSGYSDKEYLLAAVKLKAVDYVEKPISLDELSNTIKTAVMELEKSIKLDLLKQKAMGVMNEAISGLKAEAALMLTKPDAEPERLRSLLDMTDVGDVYNGVCEFIIFKVFNDTHILNGEFYDILSASAEKFNLNYIHGKKNDETYVVAVFYKNIYDIKNNVIKNFAEEVFKRADTDIYSSVGTPEPLENAYKSYQNATCGLNENFYSGYNTLTYSSVSNQVYKFDDNIIAKFTDLIVQRKRDEAVRLIWKLSAELKEKKATLVSATKNYFCILGSEILKLNRVHKLGRESDILTLLDKIHSSNTLDELIFSIVKGIDMLFDNLNTEYENNIAWKIKQYIKQNYQNQMLSLSEISDYLNLNISYISIVFKSEVGISINRYITNYRISKAKELLLKPDLRIKDIAQMVGFQNSNYFAKVFKKSEGIQPKEYRLKNML